VVKNSHKKVPFRALAYKRFLILHRKSADYSISRKWNAFEEFSFAPKFRWEFCPFGDFSLFLRAFILQYLLTAARFPVMMRLRSKRKKPLKRADVESKNVRSIGLQKSRT